MAWFRRKTVPTTTEFGPGTFRVALKDRVKFIAPHKVTVAPYSFGQRAKSQLRAFVAGILAGGVGLAAVEHRDAIKKYFPPAQRTAADQKSGTAQPANNQVQNAVQRAMADSNAVDPDFATKKKIPPLIGAEPNFPKAAQQAREPNVPARRVVEPNELLTRTVPHQVILKSFPKASSKMSVLLQTGEPYLSARQIDAELRKRGSPAIGLGWAFEKYGVQYKIRPEVGLLFYRKESTWGKYGRAIENNAIGNIEFSRYNWSGVGYINNRGFRKYKTLEDGIHDFFATLAGRYIKKGKTTFEDIIPVYAPAEGGNNPAAYINNVVGYASELYKNAGSASAK